MQTEHGPNRDDELNLLVTGNFGWDPKSTSGPGYNEAVPMTDLTRFPDAVLPLWRSGSPTVAPSGATFASGSQWGTWNGVLVAGLLKGARLQVWKLGSDGTVLGQGVALTGYGRLRTPVQGPDGNLYVTTDNGRNTDKILKLTPR